MLHADGLPEGFERAVYASGLNSPTAIDVAPDGRLFVAEKEGQVKIVDHGAILPAPFLTLPVNTVLERGLSGIVLDPDFEINGFIYVFYTIGSATPVNRVSRFTVSNANANLAEPDSELILVDNIPATIGYHNGGALRFGSDGMLYIGAGDAGVPAHAQSLESLSGKILRVDPSTYPNVIPASNPFVGVEGAREEIWAYGFRNPFTFDIDPASGLLYVNDVGEATWEEIDRVTPGGNYGWPISEGPTGDPPFIGPVHAASHADGASAFIGGTFYVADAFPEIYHGQYFFAELGRNYIATLDAARGNVVTPFAENVNFVVDLDVSPTGSLYYTDFFGDIIEIKYVGDGNHAPTAVATADVTHGTGPLDVSFSGAGSRDADGDALSYSWNFGDGSFLGTDRDVTHRYEADGVFHAVLTVSAGRGGTAHSQAIVISVGDAPPTSAIQLTGRSSFVAALYRDALGRAPEPGAVDVWQRLLDAGLPRAKIVGEIVSSSEFFGRRVNAMYARYLGRPAADDERAGWVAMLRAGVSLIDMEAQVATSAEYVARRASDVDFIANLYADVIGRPADDAGSAGWLDALSKGASRAVVALFVALSTEKVKLVVAGSYEEFLGRSASPAELANWVAIVGGSRSGLSLPRLFFSSDEYADLATRAGPLGETVTTYAAGDTISFAGSAVDEKDGELPPSAYRWKIVFHHDDHIHPFLGPFDGVQSGQFTIPTKGEASANAWYRLQLTVTDAAGLTHESFADITPRTSTFTLATAPGSVRLAVNGQPHDAPYTFQGVVGMAHDVQAPALTSIDGRTYAFVGWSDGKAADRVLFAPVVDSTYVATYQVVDQALAPLCHFVAAVYRDVLGRPVDPAGLAVWVDLLARGASRALVAGAVWNSPEHRSRQVDEMFAALLNGVPTADEKQVYVRDLLTGATEHQARLQLLTSQEFLRSWEVVHGGDFLDRLYSRLLGQLADAATKADWMAQMKAGLSKADVAATVLSSEEYYRRQLEAFFADYLGRGMTTAEQDTWVSAAVTGASTPEDVARVLLASDEYFAASVAAF